MKIGPSRLVGLVLRGVMLKKGEVDGLMASDTALPVSTILGYWLREIAVGHGRNFRQSIASV